MNLDGCGLLGISDASLGNVRKDGSARRRPDDSSLQPVSLHDPAGRQGAHEWPSRPIHNLGCSKSQTDSGFAVQPMRQSFLEWKKHSTLECSAEDVWLK